MENIKGEIGRRVRECREQMGVSQARLAESVGITETAIGLLERGKVWPQLDNLELIAEALGVRTSDLLRIGPLQVVPQQSHRLKLVEKVVQMDELTAAYFIQIYAHLNDLAEPGRKKVLEIINEAFPLPGREHAKTRDLEE